MKTILYFISVLIPIGIFGQNIFIINGHTSTNQDGEKIFYYYHNGNKLITDSTQIENGTFRFENQLLYPTGLTLSTRKDHLSSENSIFFFTGGGISEVTIDYMDFKLSSIEENSFQKEYLAYKKRMNEINLLLRENFAKSLELSRVTDENIKSKLIRENDSITEKLKNELITENIAYIKENPDSYIALYNINHVLLGNKAGRKRFDEVKNVFNRMNPFTKNNELGVLIENKLKNLQENTAGNFAKNFSALDINGNIFSLEDSKNKNFVLLDFWATWCEPCKLEVPTFKRLNDKYKNKGLKIISLSQDSKKEAWEKEVKNGDMKNWTNILLDKNNTKKILQNYAVQAIPFKVLISKEGKIIATWTGYDEKQSLEMEKTISNYLE